MPAPSVGVALMVFADPPSDALRQALQLLAEGQPGEAEAVVKKADVAVKAKHGSGSHPLAQAYADIARLHLRMGEFQKAAVEFQHASKGPLPADPSARRDRLGFMLGFGEALAKLVKWDEAEKVFRQCVVFAKNLHGATSAQAAAVHAPLADALLKAGKPADSLQVAQEAYDALWQLGDSLITTVIPVRAEALKAAGKADNPFADLTELPDEMATAAVAGVLGRAAEGPSVPMRAVLADLLKFADKKHGDGHPVTCDVLAAVAHHEARLGAAADPTVRVKAVKRAVWSFAVRRMPGGLLSNLEIDFEPTGALHLVPHVSREPSPAEAAELDAVLTQAVDDLYSRPALRA
ncbi:MAG: tetratricopeptide repeat protein [Gemmataceae bacterium]|nr:tetratricopeptide repeat protein [Gemmataceae bacterium]